ncbi:MAG: HNH endonuclease [Deltaproteobacteria bacterium]|nr:MAG: HNH endonuclease [Deltaproteobacteria bacterium]TMB31640.1 MAG: HNH endonuclease [Deltaproteobacteria bacterium]
MIDSTAPIPVMNDDDLIASTRELARKSNGVEAELLLYLGEIDARKIYRERASPSMIAFCMREFNFSEGAAAYRIHVARFARELPAILDALRSGAVHLSGLRVLVPHLNAENHQRVLAQAAGKSKREIEELAAALSPQPPAPDIVRKLPNRELVLMAQTAAAASRPSQNERRPVVAPLSADTFKIEFTASRATHDKLRRAQDLLRHRIPNGNLAQVFDKALDVLIAKVLKERFAVGRKGRRASAPITSASHEAPDPMKREVYERDEGRCAFVAEDGTRCPETGFLEIDHIDGFARTHVHDRDRSRLLCRTHNQLSAEQLYGREFMERLRQERKEAKAAARPPPSQAPEALLPTRPGACAQQQLF